MTEIKTHYNISNLDAREINFALNQIANRLDALEGLRGTPKFYANINANDHKIQNVTDATAAKEALTYDYTENLGDAAFQSTAQITAQTFSETNITLGDSSSGNYLTIINGTITIYADGEIVHKIEGAP